MDYYKYYRVGMICYVPTSNSNYLLTRSTVIKYKKAMAFPPGTKTIKDSITNLVIFFWNNKQNV